MNANTNLLISARDPGAERVRHSQKAVFGPPVQPTMFLMRALRVTTPRVVTSARTTLRPRHAVRTFATSETPATPADDDVVCFRRTILFSPVERCLTLNLLFPLGRA